MDCIVCGRKCGTTETPMHYLLRRNGNGDRNDIGGFCSAECAIKYVENNPNATQDVPRCAKCQGIIINGPWYTSSGAPPVHHECL